MSDSIQNEDHFHALVYLARVSSEKELVEHVEAIFAKPDFNWSIFLNAAIKQKVAGLILLNIRRWGLRHLVPSRIFHPLNLFYIGNQERNKRLTHLTGMILNHLERSGVDARPLKGAVLLPLIYSDYGSRLLFDIDFFVNSNQLDLLRESMAEIGFSQGTYDDKTKRITPYSRKERLIWQIKMFETPPFFKFIDDEYLGITCVDFSFGFSFAEPTFETHPAMSNGQELGGYKTFAADDFFLYLCCHLYKEASNEAWKEIEADINLIKFCDVRETFLTLFKKENLQPLVGRAEELNLIEPLYFSIFYCHDIFMDLLLVTLIELLEPLVQQRDFMTNVYRQGTKAVGTRQLDLRRIIVSA